MSTKQERAAQRRHERTSEKNARPSNRARRKVAAKIDELVDDIDYEPSDQVHRNLYLTQEENKDLRAAFKAAQRYAADLHRQVELRDEQIAVLEKALAERALASTALEEQLDTTEEDSNE